MEASLLPPQVSRLRGSQLAFPDTGLFSQCHLLDQQSGSSFRCKRSGGRTQSARYIHGQQEKSPVPLKPAASLPHRTSATFQFPSSEPFARDSTWPASQLLDTQSRRDVSARAQTDRPNRRPRYPTPPSAPRDGRGAPPGDAGMDPPYNDSHPAGSYDPVYREGGRGGWERGGRGGGGGGGWDYNDNGEEDGEKPGGEIVLRGVNKFVLASVFTIGIGAGVAFSTVVNLGPTNVASRDVIDQKTPNPDVCLANGASAMVLDQRLFISFNPFNVYVSQAEVKPGCVLRQSNWQVLESRGLVNKDEVRDCKRNMNTFGFVGDLRQAPEISCVYHSETAENQFLKDPSKAALGDGFQPKDFRE